jgi:hypothetical protein
MVSRSGDVKVLSEMLPVALERPARCRGLRVVGLKAHLVADESDQFLPASRAPDQTAHDGQAALHDVPGTLPAPVAHWTVLPNLIEEQDSFPGC